VPRIHFILFAMILTMAGAATAQQPGWGTQPNQPGWGTQPPPPTQPTPPPPTQPTQPGWGTQPNQPGWGTQPPPPTQPTPPPPTQPTPPPPPPEPSAPAAPIAGGQIGLGFSNHFAPMFNTGNILAAVIEGTGVGTPPGDTSGSAVSTYYVNLSMRYRLTVEHELEALLGFSYLNLTHADYDDPLTPGSPEDIAMDGFLFHLGFRYLYTIAGNERARLYTGAGFGLMIATATGDKDDANNPHAWQDWLGWGITIGAPLGFEYRFEAAPQLALTLEVQFALGYVSGTMTSHAATGSGVADTDVSGGSLLLGLGQAADLQDSIYIPILDYVSFGLHYYF